MRSKSLAVSKVLKKISPLRFKSKCTLCMVPSGLMDNLPIKLRPAWNGGQALQQLSVS